MLVRNVDDLIIAYYSGDQEITCLEPTRRTRPMWLDYRGLDIRAKVRRCTAPASSQYELVQR
jgi:hypothetical protein